MNRIRIATLALCATAFACGGDGDGDHGSNAAASKTFTYGPPSAASSGQRRSVETPLASAARTGGSSGAALELANFQNTADSLLGSTGGAFLRQAAIARELRQEIPRLERLITDPGCLSVSGNTYTYKNCQATFDFGGSSSNATLNGTISISSDQRTLSWDLSIVVTGSPLGTPEDVRAAHESGSVTVEPGHIKGDLRTEVTTSTTSGGTTSTGGTDEQVLFDLQYQASPFCVISGSFEVKRVSTQQPGGRAQPDKAVKMTWSGCNQATIASSI